MNQSDAPQEEQAPSGAGAMKIAEYVARVAGGEALSAIVDGLPPGMRAAVEAGVAASAIAAAPTAPDVPATPPAPEASAEQAAETGPAGFEATSVIPPQYDGMPSWLVEEMWTLPIYVDPAKNVEVQARRAAAIAAIKEREAAEAKREDKTLSTGERLVDLKKELGIPTPAQPVEGETEFSNFKVSNGETAPGAFWYSWRNREAKRLKESGALEWGKERIYFDVPLASMEALRDTCIAVAGRERVAIAFKHVDVEKSDAEHLDADSTRFVTNFASAAEAARFYVALAADPGYQALVADRAIDYKGLRLDSLAEYASGYREARAPLDRIVRSSRADGSGGFLFDRVNGGVGRLSADEMAHFQKMHDAMTAKLAEAEQAFAGVVPPRAAQSAS